MEHGLWGFPSGVVLRRQAVLAGAHQSGPAFVLTFTRRSLLFVCLLPALHLTELSHCKMRKNAITVGHFTDPPLCTSSLAGRVQVNPKRREMGIP